MVALPVSQVAKQSTAPQLADNSREFRNVPRVTQAAAKKRAEWPARIFQKAQQELIARAKTEFEQEVATEHAP